MVTNSRGIQLIKNFESLHDGDLSKVGLQPKLCPANVWTVGYGHAIVDPITKKMLKGDKDKTRAYELFGTLSAPEAETLLKVDLQAVETDVTKLTKNSLNSNQFSALVSFQYNTGGLGTSTLLKKVLINPLDPTIAIEFMKWTKATVNGVKVELKGLVNRRKAEAELYFLV